MRGQPEDRRIAAGRHERTGPRLPQGNVAPSSWSALPGKTSSDIGSHDAIASWHAASHGARGGTADRGGRSGVGKTTVGWEVAAQLRAAAVSHVIIEGDYMGQVHPGPEGDPDASQLVERNLAAVWANFAECGYRRLIYTNTLSVLPAMSGMFERAMGADVRIVRVLLTVSDSIARERLVGRELGSELEQGLEASTHKAGLLDKQAAADTARVVTDGRPVVDIAREVVAATGWAG